MLIGVILSYSRGEPMVQIVGTAGVGFNIVPGLLAGYRFQHFSDAGSYGPTSLGVDMHILEINYRL